MTFPVSNERQFGFVIAYLIPGFLVVLGIGQVSPTVSGWLAMSSCSPTIGGFFYAVLASLFAGLFCSTVRWLTVDSLHAFFGIRIEKWEMEHLAKNIDAFELLVAYHYRYYQFYSNMLISIPIALYLHLFSGSLRQHQFQLVAIACLVELVFFIGSRDTFKKYANRSNELLKSRSILVP